MSAQSTGRIYTISAAKTISTDAHSMSGKKNKNRSNINYNYFVRSPIYIYNDNIKL